MIEEKLESLRKGYLKTKTPDYLVNYGWSNLQSRLGEVQSAHFAFVVPRNIAFASLLLIIILVSTIAVSQSAKPGDNLYPVKIASDKITAKVTGNYEAIIEKRAQEVIDTSNNGPSFDEAKKQYQITIDEAKDKSQKEDEAKKEELRKNLEEQEKKFQEVQKEGQKNQNRLEQVVKETRRTRGEVKGEKDNQREEQDQDESNQNNKNKDSEDEGSNRESNDD